MACLVVERHFARDANNACVDAFGVRQKLARTLELPPSAPTRTSPIAELPSSKCATTLPSGVSS